MTVEKLIVNRDVVTPVNWLYSQTNVFLVRPMKNISMDSIYSLFNGKEFITHARCFHMEKARIQKLSEVSIMLATGRYKKNVIDYMNSNYYDVELSMKFQLCFFINVTHESIEKKVNRQLDIFLKTSNNA